MINRVVLVGRITKDPILRKTQSGVSVSSFTIAANRRSKQEGQPDADFINCVAWNKTADLLVQYIRKGALIGIEGRIQTRSYDAEGKRIYVTEVVAELIQFLESKKTKSNEYVPTNESNMQEQDGSYDAMETFEISSDDLPF